MFTCPRKKLSQLNRLFPILLPYFWAKNSSLFKSPLTLWDIFAYRMGNKLDRLLKNSILIWDLQTVGYSLSQLNPKRFNEFPSHDEICNVGGIQSAWPLEVKITFALNFGSKPSDSLLMSIISGVQTLSAVTTIWSIPPCISGFHIIKSSCQVYLSVKAYQHDFEFAKMNHFSWHIIHES